MRRLKIIVLLVFTLSLVGCAPKFKDMDAFKELEENKDKITTLYYSVVENGIDKECYQADGVETINEFYKTLKRIVIVKEYDSNTDKDYGDNQKRRDPGMWGRVDLGIEFLPYESFNIDYQRLVKIDLRGYFKYNGEGRAYSELADAFGSGNCYTTQMTNGGLADEKCGWVAEKWSNAGKDHIMDMANRSYTGTLKEDGMFDYEGFATVGGALNITVQPIQYVAIIAGVAADYTQNHFITFTKVGNDRGTANAEGTALLNNTKDGIVTDSIYDERTPAFSTALDRAGQRLKRTESLNLEWFAGVRVMY